MTNNSRSGRQQPIVLGPRKAHDASEPGVLGPVGIGELVEELIVAAFRVMHHDADPDRNVEAAWERNELRAAFTKLLVRQSENTGE